MGAATAVAIIADRPLRDPKPHPVAENLATTRIEPDCRTGVVIPFNGQERELAAWMSAAQRGDLAAYDNVVRASIPVIKKVALRRSVPIDLIDDVVQESLLTVHLNLKNYDARCPFKAWLRTIAHRRSVDILRNRYRTALRETYAPLAIENHADPADNPEDQTDQADRKNLLGVIAASLPPRQREAVDQLAVKGRSLTEAATKTGLTPLALKMNLYRALTKLRARVKAHSAATCAYDIPGMEPALLRS